MICRNWQILRYESHLADKWFSGEKDNCVREQQFLTWRISRVSGRQHSILVAGCKFESFVLTLKVAATCMFGCETRKRREFCANWHRFQVEDLVAMYTHNVITHRRQEFWYTLQIGFFDWGKEPFTSPSYPCPSAVFHIWFSIPANQ